MDKRKNHRIEINDLTVDVSDGIGFCTGSANDISKFGLGLVNMSKKFGKEAKRLTVVITAEDKVFKMNVKPRWDLAEGLSKKIGAEIEQAPWEWTEFVLEHDDQKEQDVWGSHL